jgi:hypothetical protein
MLRLTRFALVAGILLSLSALVAAPALAGTTTTFYLNSYNSTDNSGAFCSEHLAELTSPPGCGTVVTSPIVFTEGTTYTVRVVGAVDPLGEYTYRSCGKPDIKSEFPSSGLPNEPAGDDAQFRFGEPRGPGKCPHLPEKVGYFQVNLGSAWAHPVANGNPSKPPKETKAGEQSAYTFTIVGEGAAPQFRYVDFHASDNDGEFQINVTEVG